MAPDAKAQTTAPSTPLILGADDVVGLPWHAALQALLDVLSSGFDPEHDGVRTRLATPHGQMMQMPAAFGQCTGTKILTLTPENPLRGLPDIQGVYVLFEGEEQRPAAVLDGAALTRLRTPAVSALGLWSLGHRRITRALVFGTGVQAWGHLSMLHSVFGLERAQIVARRPAAADELARRVQDDLGIDATGHSLAEAEGLARAADVIVCCTASPVPLFSGGAVSPRASVVAVGSHEARHSELDRELMARAQVCVESSRSALAEAGEVIDAVAAGVLDAGQLVTLAQLHDGAVARAGDRPAVVKTTGMPWEDLAVAAAAYRRALQAGVHP